MKRWLLAWSSCNKEKTVTGVVTPPAIGYNMSYMENQSNDGSHEFISLGGMNPCQFQGIDPREGAEFDKNGPSVTEDVDFAIGTTLVRIKGPEVVQSSGVE